MTALIVMTALLAALVAGLVIAKNLSSGSDDSTETTAETVSVIKRTLSEITSVKFTAKGESKSFLLNSDGDWYYTDDENFPLDQDFLTNITGSVCDLSAYRQIDSGSDSDYGFDNATIYAEITYNTSEIHTYLFGSTIKLDDISYQYMKADNSTVYLVDTAVSSMFDYSVTDLLQTDKLPDDLTSDNVTSVSVNNGSYASSITDADGIAEVYPKFEKLDFSSVYAEYIEEGAGDELYGFTDASPYVSLVYTSLGENTEYKVIFGTTHNELETKTDETGATTADEVTYRYYRPVGSRVAYSLDENAYQELLKYSDYAPAE